MAYLENFRQYYVKSGKQAHYFIIATYITPVITMYNFSTGCGAAEQIVNILHPPGLWKEEWLV